jgi:hypothetical protein
MDGLDQDADKLEAYLNRLDENDEDDDVPTANICKKFLIYEKYRDYYIWITSVSIIIYNYLFYMTTFPILSKAGFHLKTREY